MGWMASPSLLRHTSLSPPDSCKLVFLSSDLFRLGVSLGSFHWLWRYAFMVTPSLLPVHRIRGSSCLVAPLLDVRLNGEMVSLSFFIIEFP